MFDGYVFSVSHPDFSNVVQSLINSEIAEINNKIKTLDSIRERLEQDLLKLHEDELELDDERKSLLDRACETSLICRQSGACRNEWNLRKLPSARVTTPKPHRHLMLPLHGGGEVRLFRV
jgi:division protein 1